MRTKFIFFVLMFTSIISHSQQDAQYTQYMYNTNNINPAYAGSRQILSIFALHRTQWVGLDGAPVTNNFSINGPVNNSNIGLGLNIISDKIGPSDETNVDIDFSYTIRASQDFQLSFGLKASANLLNIDFTKLNNFNSSDPRFQYNIDNKFSPNFGAGIYLHSDKTYIGFSVPNFLETKHFDGEADDNADSYTAKERMNYYLIAGHVFDLSQELKFKPAFLGKLVTGAPLQADISANFLYNEKFVLGAAYRWSAAVSLMAGFQVSQSLYIGYGYDLETTRLANYNSGSHEIFLRYELFKNNKVISPRFF